MLYPVLKERFSLLIQDIPVLSQSGAVCTSILDFARKENVGFSHFVSLGSMVDVNFADMLDFFSTVRQVESIVMYVENITHIRKFMSAARAVSSQNTQLIMDHFYSLSPRSVYLRFFSPVKQLSKAVLIKLTQIDYDREVALVAVMGKGDIEETSSSMEEMSSMTRRNAENSDNANGLMQEAAHVIGSANTSEEISHASKEQSSGIDQVNIAISEMDKVVQQNAAVAEESASAAEEMSAQAE